jgi:streptogramin lyase
VAIEVDGEFAWVVSYHSLTRIELATFQRTTFELPGEGEFADVGISGNRVWLVSTGAKQAIRVDTGTGEIVSRVSLDHYPTSIAVSGEDLWITTTEGSGEVLRVDGRTGEVGARWAVGEGPAKVQLGATAVFVLSRSAGQAVYKIDGIGEEPERVPALDVAIEDDVLWVLDLDGRHLEKRQSHSLDLLGRTEIPETAAIAADPTSVWLMSPTGSIGGAIYLPDPDLPSALTRVDPATGLVASEPILVGTTPAWLAVGAGHGWFAEYEAERVTVASAPVGGPCSQAS